MVRLILKTIGYTGMVISSLTIISVMICVAIKLHTYLPFQVMAALCFSFVGCAASDIGNRFPERQ